MYRIIPSGMFRVLTMASGVFALSVSIAFSTAAVRAESPTAVPFSASGDNANIAGCWSCGVHYDECVGSGQALTRCVRQYVECRMDLCRADAEASSRFDVETMSETPLPWRSAD